MNINMTTEKTLVAEEAFNEYMKDLYRNAAYAARELEQRDSDSWLYASYIESLSEYMMKLGACADLLDDLEIDNPLSYDQQKDIRQWHKEYLS